MNFAPAGYQSWITVSKGHKLERDSFTCEYPECENAAVVRKLVEIESNSRLMSSRTVDLCEDHKEQAAYVAEEE